MAKRSNRFGVGLGTRKINILHPKYCTSKIAMQEISLGCLNNWVDGWIDWNMYWINKVVLIGLKIVVLLLLIVDPEK